MCIRDRYQSLAKRCLTDNQSSIVILNGSGNDFRRAGAVLVYEDDEGILGIVVSRLCPIVLNRSARLASGLQDKFIFLKEGFSNLDSLLKQAAGVPAKVKNEALQLGWVHLLQSFLEFLPGRFFEAVHLPLTDSGPNHVGEVNGVLLQRRADDIQFERLLFP